MNKTKTFYPIYKKLSLSPIIVVLLLLTFSCEQRQPIADIIFLNGKIVTVDKDFSIMNALATTGDKIIAVGSNKEIKKFSGNNTKIINLKGRTVIPGIIDAHAHPEQASLSEHDDEIPDVHSINELLAWIRHQASVKEEGEWIIHPKMFYTRLKDLKRPTLEELNAAAPFNPVFLNGSYGGLINSAAMEASGFAENDIAIELSENFGTEETAGFIKSSDFELLDLPSKEKLSNEEEVEALKIMFNNYNQFGITGVISGYADLDKYYRYEDLSRKGELTVRVTQNFRLSFDYLDSKERLIDSLKTFPTVTGEGNQWIQTGSLKIFLDGGILTGTAYLREPWGEVARNIYGIGHSEYRGVINYTREELINIVTAACETGWTFTAHVTGGGGVDLLLDVFEEINENYPLRERRVSIIHGNFFTKEAMERMEKLGVIANVQAPWFYKDADAMRHILGEDRVKTFNPYKSMIENGVILSAGSDHMVKLNANSSINPYNPFLSMWSMITRKTERGTIISPEEAINREEALKIYTINNAYATFEESLKGSLEPGKLADLAVLSDDLLNCPVDQIKDIKSLLTLVGGKVVYSSNEEL